MVMKDWIKENWWIVMGALSLLLLLFCFSAKSAPALDVGENVKLDAAVSYGHLVRGMDNTTIDEFTQRTSISYDTRYKVEGELGVTIADVVRGSITLETIEFLSDTVKLRLEGYPTKFLPSSPFNIGPFVEYEEIYDRRLDDGNQIIWVGVTARLK